MNRVINIKQINVIGAGLAGVEAANYLANKGIKVKLYEMRPIKMTPAHKTPHFAELVCSNSLRSDSLENAVGILKREMEMFDSIVMNAARKYSVEAGGALAVDREPFSEEITRLVKNNKNIEIIYGEVDDIDFNSYTIIATGPLTSDALGKKIKEVFGEQDFYFFDAAAPIITAESINYDIVYLKSRYDKGEASYLNCPFTKEEFDAFYQELIHAEGVEPKEFELKVFEGCMPIEIMAKRGPQTLTFGPMKPVGLKKPDGSKPYAVVQLRKDNAIGSLYNIVGFQTHLKYGEQKRVFSMIPGLKNADFIKYGVMHKNTYINSPKILNATFQTKKHQNIFFAGQITGVEGYIESAASGLCAAINMYRYINKQDMIVFPTNTIMGSMANYIVTASETNFQPMNANFGILQDIPYKHSKKERKSIYASIALKAMEEVKNKINE